MTLPIRSFKDFIGGLTVSDLKSLAAFSRSGLFSWVALILLALAGTFISTISLEKIPANLEEGMIAIRNIKADRSYDIVDEEATQKFKDEALAEVLPVFDMDTRATDAIIKRLHDVFRAVREISSARSALTKENQKEPAGEDARMKEIRAIFANDLGFNPTAAQLEALSGEKFGERVESAVATILRKIMIMPIVSESGMMDAGRGVILREPKSGGDAEHFEEKILADPKLIISIDNARAKLADISAPGFGFRNPAIVSSISAMAVALIEPNCAMNRAETERRKEEASVNVKNVILKVKAGEMIIREGSRYEPWHIKVLKGIQRERRGGVYSLEFLGTFLIFLLFIIIPFYLAERFFRRISVSRSDHYLMAILGLSTLCIIRLSLLVAPAIHDSIFFSVDPAVLVYAIPVAGGAMLLKMFLGSEITLVYAVVTSALTAFFVETDVNFAAYSIIASFTAVIGIANADRRSQILKAGALTGVAGAVVVLGISLIGVSSATQTMRTADLLWGMGFAFIGGVGSAIFTMIFAPLVESFSGYTSDIKLLELANLNHPLLRELIVRAPGTYHHSHMVGILGEAAAEAIGANALLVRVGAYYHDIGKMKKPLYFVENARSGENKHDKLSPHMSAMIVSAHVKDGVDMAEKANTPKSIVNMIPEHHGTRLISFFFEKAKEMKETHLQNLEEKDFIYPGPKPQSRESAILMLADATEAAVRSLKEKSTTRIQQTVQRVITDIFMEKQLDECDLTLKDLNEIARAFMRILLGIYHSRVEYPKDSETEKPEVSIVEDAAVAADTNKGDL